MDKQFSEYGPSEAAYRRARTDGLEPRKERTFGGHGVISGDFEADYAGTFGENGANHYGYLSSRVVKDYNGNILEGIGVFPDIEMSYAEGTFKGGEDSWLTRAVEYIHNGI